jgi:hypothetical protein
VTRGSLGRVHTALESKMAGVNPIKRKIPEPEFFEDHPLTPCQYRKYLQHRMSIGVNESIPNFSESILLGVWSGSTNFKDSNIPATHRSVPVLLRELDLIEELRNGRLSLRCSHLVAGGIGRFAQVWSGTIYRPGQEDSAAPVILKFYRDTFWDGTCWDAHEVANSEYQVPTSQHAQSEVWAYYHMRALQGKGSTASPGIDLI